MAPALNGILREFGPGLARVAASYEADRGLREDLLQEITLAIHVALPSLRDPQRIAPFVFRIAHNRGVAHVISERRRRLTPSPETPAAAGPEELLLAADRRDKLLAAVRRLPLPYRQVLTLLLEELSHADIAEALGLTVGNVAVRVNRAKIMIRELLDDAD